METGTMILTLLAASVGAFLGAFLMLCIVFSGGSGRDK